MMGIDDFFLSFIASYLAGLLPSLKDIFIKEEKETLQEGVDNCYQKALERWCSDDSVRNKLANQHFSNINQLKEYMTSSDVEDSANTIDEIVKLWADELRKDEDCAHNIQEQELHIISGKIDYLTEILTKRVECETQKLKPRGRKQHQPVDNYIRRYCSSEQNENSFIPYLSNQKDRKCLADYVIGLVEPDTNKYILYSSAQTGKTFELNELCWELQKSGLYLPISFEVRTNTTLKREDLPDCRYYGGKEIVVVIDALDEVNGKKYDDLIEEIGGYAYDHPEIKIVLSCRSNYRRESQINQFKELYLQELTYKDAQEHVENRLGKAKATAFIKYINNNELSEFVKNPFYLNVLIGAFNNPPKQLPRTKSEIYRLFVEKSYHTEKEDKKIPLVKQHSFDESIEMLERVALGLSLLNVQTLSREELRYCLGNDDNNVVECLRYDLIRCEDGRYSFCHNAFREWLVANYLSRAGINRAKKLATHPNGRIKPEWYNIIMLWLSMYGKERKKDVKDILGWLKDTSLELIIYIDRGAIDEKTRNEVFKGVLLEYKALGIRMSNIMTQDYKNLLSFGQSEETVRFIADELSEAIPNTAYYADLMCLCYFLDWNILSLQNEATTEQLFQVLEKKTKEALEQKPSHDLSFLYFDNDFFVQKNYLDRIFSIIGHSDHYEAIRSMVRLIEKANRADDYVDYILEKEGFVHSQQEGHTTHIVTRNCIFTALSQVTTADGIKKVLTHQFYDPRTAYRDEQEDFKTMMEHMLDGACNYIKKGRTEFVDILEEYYVSRFKDYHYYFSHDKQSQEYITILRNCYLNAGLRERGRGRFYKQVDELFTPHEKEDGEWERIRKTFSMAALWMTPDDVKQDFGNFKPDNQTDLFKASWYREIPYQAVAECASELYQTVFPQRQTYSKGRERRIQAFNDFTNYIVFKQLVLEMVNIVDDQTTRKELGKRIKNLDEGYNQYAYRFILHYVGYDDKYNVNGIIKDIKNKEVYDGFYMKEIANLLSSPTNDISVTEELQNRCMDIARQSVINISHGNRIVYFYKEALELLLKGYFEVPVGTLPKLLDYGVIQVSRKDNDGYYHREYSLFEYITEHVDSGTLGPIVYDKLRANVDKEGYRLSYSLCNYIIDQQIEEGYALVVRYATSGFNLSGNILESLVKNGIKIEEIKEASKNMKVTDRVFCYSSLVRHVGEVEWVREKLESEFKIYSGYDLKLAVRLLLSIGSMDALDYLVTHPELINDGVDYHFNYDNPNAIPSLCYFINYNYEHWIDDGPFMLSSILTSLEKISLRDKDSLEEVKRYLRQLTQKGDNFKYLNRYIIAFEDKYYAAYSGIENIEGAMDMIDTSLPEKTKEEKTLALSEWSDDEGVYISYNWESHSLHIVDFLCFVLENKGIPHKRDKKDCLYTDNIKEFMNAIKAGRTVIVVFSRPYLKSKNCMYELSGILENPDFKNRILPVVVDDTIRDSQFYVDLVKYWKDEKDKQESIVKQLEEIDLDMAEPEQVKLDEIQRIYELLKVIKEYIDWVNADNLDALSSTRFKSIVEKIISKKNN